MRVTNTTPHPIAEVKELLAFAARGVRSAGIEVHVKRSRYSYRGMAYDGIPHMANVAKATKRLITIGLGATWDNGSTNPIGKRIRRLWPEGIVLDGWQDGLVYIGAHEFRHAWQKMNHKRGKGEYDAEKHAHKMLNRWREHTGRAAVPPIKQPNPFAGTPQNHRPTTPTQQRPSSLGDSVALTFLTIDQNRRKD